MNTKENFSHAAIVLQASKMETSIEFYTKKLGFNTTFSWEEPATYVVLKKGNIIIHLSKNNDIEVVKKHHTSIYIFVYNISEVYERCVDEKITVTNAPKYRDYKMTDFDIIDPDGHIITFGCGV